MSGPGGAETPQQRRARLDRVFGDVLPETTRDDRPERDARPSTADASAADEHLLRDVPPHHG